MLVFTDAIPVDGDLNPLSDSYWKFKKINPATSQSLNQSLVCIPVLGCASGMNRALVKMLTPVPEAVTGHDWWALLVAAALGKVAYISDRTMMYRLHGNNASVPQRVTIWDYFSRMHEIAHVRHGMKRRRLQAQALLERFGDRLPPARRRVVEDFIATGSQNFVQRRFSLLKGQYTYPDLPRNIAMFLGA